MEKRIEKQLLKKANRPQEQALKLHKFYRGKIEIIPKCRIKDFNDFAIWYTPGVAAVSKAIEKQKELVFEYTNKWNTIAIISDGTRVLGLGDIGPEAALPVMEGKALLFKYLGGVDAVCICINTKDTEEIIRTVKILQPSFGGINLEDISQPKCFEILERLKQDCEIPIWHDDQQGTATVTLAALINALKIVNKKINNIKIAMIGAGAANICIARILIKAGVEPGKIIMVDSKGTLHKHRNDLKQTHKQKWELCLKTNQENIIGSAPDAIKNSDVLISLSASGPGIIKKEWIKTMNNNAIVFVCANPIPEIWPWEAKEAGAKIVATGRSDFPNQVNNSLGFPGIFRGVLDVRAKTITDEMCIEASIELAKCAEEKGIGPNNIIPNMDDINIFPRIASVVGNMAVKQGIARNNLSKKQIYSKAQNIIKRSRQKIKFLMDK